MNHLDEFDIFNDTDDEIPAFGLALWSGGFTSTGQLKVVKPTADSQSRLVVVGEFRVLPRSAGKGSFAPRCIVAFDPAEGGVPSQGDTLGSKAGSWLASVGNTGFVCYGGRSQSFAACVRADDEAENSPGGSGGAGGSKGCDWVSALTKDDCLRVSVVSGEGRCGCAEPSEEEVKLTSTDGETWGVPAGTFNLATGCLDGMELPDAGLVQATDRDPDTEFNCVLEAVVAPIVSVGEMHWATSGGYGEGPGPYADLHLECVDGVWTAWQALSDVDPELEDNPGTLVDQFCLVDDNGNATATVRFRFSFTSPCTWTGLVSFQFVVDECAGTSGPKLKICESDVLVTFEKNCCGLPKLTLTGFELADVCCDEETFAETVAVTIVKDDVTYTGEWDESGGVWSGELTGPPPPPPPPCCDTELSGHPNLRLVVTGGFAAGTYTLVWETFTTPNGWRYSNMSNNVLVYCDTSPDPDVWKLAYNLPDLGLGSGTLTADSSQCDPFQAVFTGVGGTITVDIAS